jgi:hypothetical protein
MRRRRRRSEIPGLSDLLSQLVVRKQCDMEMDMDMDLTTCAPG